MADRNKRNVVTLQKRGSGIVIPLHADVLKRLGWNQGDYVKFDFASDVLMFRKVTLPKFSDVRKAVEEATK